ncbi:hypothetical protein EG329_007068 [Mollisiaceae sp. DMI_Dod_QoI]|nr:hypothetical protein EG329_007068 [Helotiales sp. DMI_Dod_QoI]
MSGHILSSLGGENVGGRAWIDVESDPVSLLRLNTTLESDFRVLEADGHSQRVFQEIVRKLGARGVNIQEVYGLEDQEFDMLTGSPLGMIFLFNYRSVDGQEGEEVELCPGHVWFANQTTNNACATVALLNILLNVPGVDFRANGSADLRAFKDSTAGLTAAERGQRLAESNNIRQIHNSFARNLEALNASLAVQNDFDEWVKAKGQYRKSQSSKRKRTSGSKTKKAKEDGEPAFHYIAYVPIRGEVWRLDGLLRQPLCLGRFDGDWTTLARANILQRIDEESDLGYSLLALCTTEEQNVLLRCLKSAVSLEAVKEKAFPTPALAQYWKSSELKPMQDPELYYTFGITRDQLSKNASLGDEALARLNHEDPAVVLRQLVGEQQELKTTYLEYTVRDDPQDDGVEEEAKDDETAATYEIMKVLIDVGVIQPRSRS